MPAATQPGPPEAPASLGRRETSPCNRAGLWVGALPGAGLISPVSEVQFLPPPPLTPLCYTRRSTHEIRGAELDAGQSDGGERDVRRARWPDPRTHPPRSSRGIPSSALPQRISHAGPLAL